MTSEDDESFSVSELSIYFNLYKNIKFIYLNF